MRSKLLVIDDNPMIHDDIKKILQICPSPPSSFDQLEQELFGGPTNEQTLPPIFEIDSAFQGEEGFQMVAQAHAAGQPYMLAFVDVRMPPGWDGIETVGRLWQVDPNLQVVICTAFSDHSWEQIIKKIGQSDGLLILKKPFDNIEVLQATHALTRKWLLHQEVNQKLEHLEELVRHRTSDLQQVNERLKQEITVRKAAEQNLKFLATHDTLTGLPNRILLHDRLHNYLARANRYQHHLAVMMLDLDLFKEINDAYGHNCGDHLLQEVAKRIGQCIRECDTAARMGGDESIILLGDLASPKEAEPVAQRITESLKRPFTIDGHSFNISASIGLCYYPNDCREIENLLKSSDLAMYCAKKKGGAQFCIYHTIVNLGEIYPARVKELLASAIENNELMLYYQPLINLKTANLAGMEALCRWNNPELGLMDPIHFIPLAEESGLIIPMGQWILRTACRQNKAWQDLGLPRIPMAVNVSARQFMQMNIVEEIKSTLQETGLDPRDLEIEITESTMMLDIDACRKKLEELSCLGVQIVVDDFGSGYSSLNRLKTLPINGIKIDRFFLQNIVDDKRDAAIVMSIIALAHSLQIKVIAEGIETSAQLEILQKLKWEMPLELQCAKGQGFLFGKPLPPVEAVRFFQSVFETK